MDSILSARSQIYIVVFSVIFGLLIFCYNWFAINPLTEIPDEEYDFVIVGAGSSGSVLGRRLSEEKAFKVLVLEAGEQESWLSSIPFLAPSLQQTYCNWNYFTEPQKYSQRGLKERKSSWPRGMCLGGSGTINYMIHSWISPEDINHWNLSDWTFDKVYPFLKKIETFHSVSTDVPIERGKTGPIHVTEFDVETSPLAKAFIKAAKAFGPSVEAVPSHASIGNGKRSSSAVEYLRPVLTSENLHVVVNALVTKILFRNNVAFGVEVVKLNSKTKHIVKAKREIILSAGAIGTPHLLLLSGIGPKTLLDKYEVPLVRDHSNVGKNLQDHLLMPMYFNLNSSVSCNAAKIKRFKELFNYFIKKKGYLAWNGVEALMSMKLQELNSTYNKASVMLFNMGSVNKMFSDIANYDMEAFGNLFPDIKNESKEGFVLMPYCSRPASRGHISLKSPFPSEPPLIDPKYLQDKEDVKCLVAAVQTILKLAKKKPLTELGAEIHKPTISCPSHVKHSFSDASFIECWIRTAAITAYHPVGTCRMGEHDQDVVDPRFRVKGIDALRVIDASVLPVITPGPPNALVMVLAERGAQFIVGDHQPLRDI